jgi:hypothetical protein
MDLKIQPFIYEQSLVFTVTSDGYKYYTWNLYKLLQALKVPWKLCVLCLDRESFDFMNKIAMIPSRLYLMPGQHIAHKDPVLFGSQQFKHMNRMKLKALEELSQRPELKTVLFLDSDIAPFQDPLLAVRTCLETHPLWFQCDEKQEGSFACSSPDSCPNPCTGVIAMSLTDETRQQFREIYKIVDDVWKESLTDQDYVLKRLQATQLSYKTLDRQQFPNGIFLANNRYKEGNPVLVHFNYILGKDKKRFMKQKECWVLPEYG